MLRSVQGDAIRNIAGNFGQNPNVRDNPFVQKFGEQMYYNDGVFDVILGYNDATRDGEIGPDRAPAVLVFNASRVTPTASEIRPVNTAVRYLIRALP
jgi:hypothetical protein